MSRPKGGEGVSDCVHDMLVEVLSIALPYMDRVVREKRVVVDHTTTIYTQTTLISTCQLLSLVCWNSLSTPETTREKVQTASTSCEASMTESSKHRILN